MSRKWNRGLVSAERLWNVAPRDVMRSPCLEQVFNLDAFILHRHRRGARRVRRYLRRQFNTRWAKQKASVATISVGELEVAGALTKSAFIEMAVTYLARFPPGDA